MYRLRMVLLVTTEVVLVSYTRYSRVVTLTIGVKSLIREMQSTVKQCPGKMMLVTRPWAQILMPAKEFFSENISLSLLVLV